MTLTPAAVETFDRLETDSAATQREWGDHLAAHGIQPGDTARLRRAANLAIDRVAAALRADPAQWMRHYIGQRPTDQAGATVWDDTTWQIAGWRARHNTPDGEPGLGPAPDLPAQYQSWQPATIGVLDAAAWLAQRPGPVLSEIRLSPSQLIDRHEELRQIVAGAPPDQQPIIAHLLTSVRHDPAETHSLLAAAARAQGDRRSWILEHWPDLVELEQVEQLIAAQSTMPPASNEPPRVHITERSAVDVMLPDL